MKTKMVKVTVNGIEYSLVSDEEDTQLFEVSALLNKKCAEIRNQGVTDPVKVAILAALQCTHELLRYQQDQKRLLEKTVQLSDFVFSM